jgi:hypothetical protein
MEATVAAFNQLPRHEKVPSGLASNHWYFAIRYVPLHPPGDMLHIIHPESRYVVTAGPAQINSLPSMSAKVDLVIRLLLDTFVKGTSRDPSGRPLSDTPPIAPWAWGCNDAELVKALEPRMKDLGVRKELCTVQVGTKEDEDVGKEEWAGLVKRLMEFTGLDASTKKAAKEAATARTCSKCDKTSDLQRCARCPEVWYCSKKCQKSHWTTHKKICGKKDTLNALDYFSHAAYTSTDAKILAASLGLTLSSNTQNEGLA